MSGWQSSGDAEGVARSGYLEPDQDGEELPSATVVVGIVAALLGGVLAGIGSGMPSAAVLALAAGLTGAAGARLSDRTATSRLVAAGVLFVLSGLALGSAVGIARAGSGGALRAALVVGVALAVLAAASPRGLTGEAVVSPLLASLTAAVIAYLGAELLGGGASGVIASITSWIGEVAWQALAMATWWDEPVSDGAELTFEVALISGAVLAGLATTSCAYAASRLDPARVAPRTERERLRERADAFERRCWRTTRGAWVATGGTILLAAVPLPYERIPGLLEAGGSLAGSPLLRVPLVVVLVASVAVLVAVKLVLLCSNLRDARPLDWVPAGLGAIATWLALSVLVVGLADPLLHPAIEGTQVAGVDVPFSSTTVGEFLAGPGTVEGVALLGTLAAVGALVPAILFGGLAVVDRLGFLDGALSAGSIAVASLVVVGLAAGLSGAGSLAVLGPVAAGLVAWDAAAFGAVLTSEIEGDEAATGPIVAHTAATGAVAILAVILALVGAFLAGDAVRPGVRVPILLALVAGLGVALWLLARRAKDRKSRTVELGLAPAVDVIGGTPGILALVATPLIAAVLYVGVGVGLLLAVATSPIVFVLVRELFRKLSNDGGDETADSRDETEDGGDETVDGGGETGPDTDETEDGSGEIDVDGDAGDP